MKLEKTNKNFLRLKKIVTVFKKTNTSNPDNETAYYLIREISSSNFNINQEEYSTNLSFKNWILHILNKLLINDYTRIVDLKTRGNKPQTHYDLIIQQELYIDTIKEFISLKEVTAAIKNLSLELKLPFCMYLAGYKYEEIASRLQISLNTVMDRIDHAYKKIRNKNKYSLLA